MKVLVLGARGQLGSDLLRLAGDFTARRVTALGRGDLDLEDLDAIAAVLDRHDFEVLVNCTGDPRTDEIETAADRAFRVNAHAVRELALACRAHGARLLHVSTDYVFSGRTDRAYREDDAPGPLNVYGASKLMGESLARDVYDQVLVLRTASLFGVAGSSGKGGNFVETMIRLGREKGKLRVVHDQVMSPTSTADLAAAIWTLLDCGAPCGVYHAVNAGEASWYEFACRILQRAEIEAEVTPIPAADYPRPARRPRFSVLDHGKLAAAIGPLPHWTDGLDRYLKAKGYCS